MNLLSFLPSLSPVCRRPAVPPRVPRELPAVPAEDEPAQPAWRCGWFDSSHELRQGLQVHEAAGAELPLELWLDWYGSGAAPQPRGRM